MGLRYNEYELFIGFLTAFSSSDWGLHGVGGLTTEL